MKAAQRIYCKERKTFNNYQSSSFRSTVRRSLDMNSPVNPGPGYYQVQTNIVRPKVEAIIKKNQSILIRVNDVEAPAFNSKERRFRQYDTIDYRKEGKKQAKIRFKEIDRGGVKKPNEYMTRKISSFRISKLLDSDSNKDLKGTVWSKYKDRRDLWSKSQLVPGPGPGFYHYERPTRHSIYIPQDTTWQFKSLTKRSFLESLETINPHFQAEHQQSLVPIHSRYNL